MITDAGQRLAISNLGWVDHGSVWSFDAQSAESRMVPLSDAKYLNIRGGIRDRFVAVHHWDGSHIRVTVQTFANPQETLGQIDVNGWTGTILGDEQVWNGAPVIYVGYLNGDATGAAGYFTIRRLGANIEIARLDWFNSDNFDLDYQGVVSVSEVPETGNSLFGIQKSSNLVLCTPDSKRIIQEVPLENRLGNPDPWLSKTNAVAWAIDYDTVVRLDRRSWNVLGSALHQEAVNGTRMFVGRLWVPASEQYLLLPRPGSGDVLHLNPVDLAIMSSTGLGEQPLDAVILGDLVVARDWKTGNTLVSAANMS